MSLFRLVQLLAPLLLPLVLLSSCDAFSAGASTTLKVDADQIPVPTGKSYLPFQLHSIRGLLNSGGILLADEMGLGKTISVIGALNVLKPPRILIVAPKSVIPNWHWELTQWLVDNQDWEIGIISAQKGIPANTNPGHTKTIWLINYDIVAKFQQELKQVQWDLVVCDEAHFLKNPEAIRTQTLLGSEEHPVSQGLPSQRWWFLTGSPILNNPSELYTLLKHMDPKGEVVPQLQNYHAFAGHFSNARTAPWGVVYKGGRNLSELRERLQQSRLESDTPLMIRRTKAQVLPDLPPKQHQLLPLWDQDKSVANGELYLIRSAVQEMIEKQAQRANTSSRNTTVAELKVLLKQNDLKVSGKKQDLIDRLTEHGIAVPGQIESSDEKDQRIASQLPCAPVENILYHSAESALRSQNSHRGSKHFYYDLIAELKQSDCTDSEYVEAVRALLTMARLETARQKIPHALEIIRQAISSHKVVVFAHHREIQQKLRDAFKDVSVGIAGGDSMKERSEAVHRFQNDDSVRVFVGSIRAAGTGITLSAASHVIFVELDWSPMVIQQAEDRCHRVGQASSVLIQYLFFPDTIDEYISQLLASKQSTINVAIDEASGPALWVFDFGKHEGLCVGEVAGVDPGYLEWLAEQKGILAKYPILAVALEDLGFIRQGVTMDNEGENELEKELEKTPTEEISPTKPASKKLGIKTTPGSYVLKFGRHKGEKLADVPSGYLHWLRWSGAARRNPTLSICLNKHLAERDK